jgi:hypothetical protein
MGDISKGVAFADGQTVSAADLNNLVDQAVINPGAVTGSKIATGAVAVGHLAAGFTLSPGQVSLANNLLLAGNASNAGVGISLGGGLSIASGVLTLSGVSGAVINSLSIPNDALSYAGVYAGAYGSPTQTLRATINAQGRVTSVSSVTLAGLARKASSSPLTMAVPSAGSSVSAFHGCVSGNNYEAAATAVVSSGTVQSVTVTAGGLGIYLTSPPTIALIGDGAGAAASATLRIESVAIQNIGSGYAVGDTLVVTGDSGTQAALTVASVDSGGGVTGVAIGSRGSFTTVAFAIGRSTTTNHTGNGCTLTLWYQLSGIAVTSGGAGYTFAQVAIGQLAAVPDVWSLSLQCVSADSGTGFSFLVGDEIPVSSIYSTASQNFYPPLAVKIHSTQIVVQRVSSGSLQTLNNTGTGAAVLTDSKWRLCFRGVNFS